MIGDEKHVIFECPALQHIRDRNAQLFAVAGQTMQQFMWQQDLRQVIIFVTDCMDFLQEPDPVEGSGA